MKFDELFWPDSQIKFLYIKSDLAELVIFNDLLKEIVKIECKNLIGLSELCMWDDTVIFDTKYYKISGEEILTSKDPFLQKFSAAYDASDLCFDYGGKKIGDGIVILEIMLSNFIWFRIYCQDIEVLRSDD